MFDAGEDLEVARLQRMNHRALADALWPDEQDAAPLREQCLNRLEKSPTAQDCVVSGPHRPQAALRP